jgi:hypothetical protein
MGIACGFIRLSDSSIATLLEEPRRIHAFMGHDEEPAPSGGGFFARLFGRPAPPPSGPLTGKPLAARQDDGESDVDKAWNAIHYLLTGAVDEADHPLAFLVNGGTPVGKEDVGYGPARVFTSAELSLINKLLEPFDRETLHARYQPREMDRAGVYPKIWARDGEDGFDYIFTNFDSMRTFFSQAEQRQLGMLVFFC